MHYFNRKSSNVYGIQGHSTKTVSGKTDLGILDKLPEALRGSVIKLISHHFRHFKCATLQNIYQALTWTSTCMLKHLYSWVNLGYTNIVFFFSSSGFLKSV